MSEEQILLPGLIFIFLTFGWIFYNMGRVVSPDDEDRG